MSYVDLHCHSTASDGTLSPDAVVRAAKEAGLSALALTDHDTIAGIALAERTAREVGIDFVAGIEISAEFPQPGTLHILGYGVDPTNPTLATLTETLIAGRSNRNPKIIEKLNELNVAVTMDEWLAEAKGGVLGRPQLAAVLARKGYVKSIKDAFNKYLGQGAPAYFDKERLSPRAAMRRIREAGGLPVLAHATQLRCANAAQLELEIKNLVDLGLAGMEVIHSDYDAPTCALMATLADKFRLLSTGGSDFHGSNKPQIDIGLANGRKIPRKFFDRLVEALRSASR